MIVTTSTRVLTALDTARLQPRPAALEDADALWALPSDLQVRRFLWDDVAIGRDRALETVDVSTCHRADCSRGWASSVWQKRAARVIVCATIAAGWIGTDGRP